ncbi:MAG: hypothetical protein HY906_24980 [Deltaproteobacteria bacterium]|nr:hypothetical protein [Deltaproteobacteria bacterium]
MEIVKTPGRCLLLGLLGLLGCGPASAVPSGRPASAPAIGGASAPAARASPPEPAPPAPRLTLRPPLSAQPDVVVSITPAALVIALRAPAGEPKVVETLARRPGTPPYDYGAFNRALARLVRTRWPDPATRPAETHQITISASPDTTYETVVHVMDAARAVRPGPGVTDAGRVLFPDVVLGVAP